MRCPRKPTVRRFRLPNGCVVVAETVVPAPCDSSYELYVNGHYENRPSSVLREVAFYASEEIL